jgi:hypothetical protein
MSNAKKHWDTLLAGWPVYSAVAVFLFAYSNLWIDKKILDATADQSAALQAMQLQVGLNTAAVVGLGDDVTRLTDATETLNSDVKAVLLHLAGD